MYRFNCVAKLLQLINNFDDKWFILICTTRRCCTNECVPVEASEEASVAALLLAGIQKMGVGETSFHAAISAISINVPTSTKCSNGTTGFS